ncbi:MAG: cell wall hydrolase [Ruminococcaceae bacterium]|nr:cell wall hydrolase [Oscillospiraceae bacterium]
MNKQKILRHGLVWTLLAALFLGMFSHLTAGAVFFPPPVDAPELGRLQYENAAPNSDVFAPRDGSDRYAALSLTENDRELLARIVYLEARGECFEGQVAVCEVVLNRVLSDAFPDSVEAVLYAPGQFSPAHLLANTTPGDTQYRAVDEAMDGRETILPENVVYFAMSPQNSRLAAHIGCHYFCEL